jgi:hypothetical protein
MQFIFAADSIDTIFETENRENDNIDKPFTYGWVLEIGALDCIARFLPERGKRETTRRRRYASVNRFLTAGGSVR